MKVSLDGRADFRSFYTAGHMVRTGQRHDVYDVSSGEGPTEHTRFPKLHDAPFYSSRGGTFCFHVPLSFWGYRTAYLILVAINSVALIWSAQLLRGHLPGLSEIWEPSSVRSFSFASIPAGFTIVLGQTQLLVLLLLCMASVAMLDGNEELPGLSWDFARSGFQSRFR